MTSQETKRGSGGRSALVSIGALAEATGIAPATLRIWERRYGSPRARRLPSGHRRYPVEEITRLRRVVEAMARGHRPSTLLALSGPQLERLLAKGEGSPGWDPEEIGRLVGLVRAYAGEELREKLDGAWKFLGPSRFFSRLLEPLLEQVGRHWAEGRLDVRHEHFVTRQVEDLLRSLREENSGGESTGPPVVLATLSGERHGLGLEILALFCALVGREQKNLGQDVPNREIALAARETGAAAVAVSLSQAMGPREGDRLLKELRRLLPEPVQLVAGGSGARPVGRGVRGGRYMDDLDSFRRWLTDLGSDHTK